jgi:hypothetical protein
VLIGLMAFAAFSLAFIGMAAVVMPQFLLMILVGSGMLLFFAAQYFVWATLAVPAGTASGAAAGTTGTGSRSRGSKSNKQRYRRR